MYQYFLKVQIGFIYSYVEVDHLTYDNYIDDVSEQYKIRKTSEDHKSEYYHFDITVYDALDEHENYIENIGFIRYSFY